MFLRICSSLVALCLLDLCIFALLFSKNRSFYFQKIKNTFCPPSCQQARLWFHAASLGEVQLVKKITQNWNINFFITTNTLGGLHQAKTFQPHSYASPLDFAFAISLWKKRMRAKGLVLIEAELWANLVGIMSKNHPVCLINGRVHPQKMQSSCNKIIYKELLAKFTLVTASSNKVYKFYLSLTNNPHIYSNGNLKFYNHQKQSPDSLRKIFPKNAFVFVAASLQAEELPIILAAFKKISHTKKLTYLVIIPRHPDKQKQFLKQLQGCAFQKLSHHPNQKQVNRQILFVPLLGVLPAWYACADSIFVGGSLCNRGGQNMIEALNYTKPTATGYNTKNFEFAMELFLASNSIVKVHNTQELVEFLKNCINNPTAFHANLLKAQRIIAKQSKALPKTVAMLAKIYKN